MWEARQRQGKVTFRFLESSALRVWNTSQLARITQKKRLRRQGQDYGFILVTSRCTQVPPLDPSNPVPKPTTQVTIKAALQSPAWPSVSPTISATVAWVHLDLDLQKEVIRAQSGLSVVTTATSKSSHKVHEYSPVLAKAIWGRSSGKDSRAPAPTLELSILVWPMTGM